MARILLATVGSILLWIFLVLAVVAVEAVFFTAPSVTRGDSASIQEHLSEAIEDAAVGHRLGAAAVALIEGGDIVFERGTAPVGADAWRHVSPDRSMFVVGSVSKMVTAWGIMKLVEDGRIGLDEPIMPYMTRWKFTGDAARLDGITVRRLLSHTSGLEDGPNDGGFLSASNVAGGTTALMLEAPGTVERQALLVVREPARAFVYGNGATTLLGFLIEELTGKPFPTYMKEQVLDPLGMHHSSFSLDAIRADGREDLLVADFDSSSVVQPRQRSAYPAAVGLHTTAHDLGRLAGAYTRQNPVLHKETLAEMLKPQPATGDSWGLGHSLFVDNGAGGHVVGHDGGAAPAWGAMFRLNPATGNGMVLTVSGGRGAVNQLGHDWIYWETGKVTTAAMRQKAQNRALPALIAIVLGSIFIIVLQVARRYFR